MKKFLLTLATAAVAAFSANAAENLWLTGTPQPKEPYYAPGWSPITTYTFKVTADGMEVTLPEATTDRWQAQFGATNTFKLETGKYYKVSCDIESNQTFTGHVKLVQNGDDNLFAVDADINIKTGTTHIEKTGKAALSAEITAPWLLFDYGTNPANTEIKITNICVEESAPETEPEVPLGENLWLKANPTAGTVYFAPAWTESTDYSFEVGEDNATITLDAATTEAWQAQFPINGSIDFDETKEYMFACNFRSTNDLSATVKLQNLEDNNAFLFTESVSIEAGESKHFWVYNLKGKKISPFKLLFDFGGNPANTTVRVSKIQICEILNPGSVNGVEIDTNATPEYYNLQGMRIDEPTDGIYIVRRGNVVTKEMIRK